MAVVANQSICDGLRAMLARNEVIVAGKHRRANSLRARIAKLEGNPKADPETIAELKETLRELEEEIEGDEEALRTLRDHISENCPP